MKKMITELEDTFQSSNPNNLPTDTNRNLRSSKKKRDITSIASTVKNDTNGNFKFPVKELNRETGVTKSFSITPYYLNHVVLGNSFIPNATKIKKNIIINHVKKFEVKHILSPFQRRVTFILWHPKYTQFFVAGSKGGDLTMRCLGYNNEDYFCPGIGAGGSIVGLKFSEDDPCIMYTASITGNICQEDLKRNTSKTLLSTFSFKNWFSCLDICYKRNILLMGDSTGHANMLSTSGKPIWKRKKLHKSKITHCEFNLHDPNLFVTASIDHYVRLWDLRSTFNCSEKIKPLCEYYHEKAVNSAYFSPSNGLSLLTTDQHSQLRVYSSPFWDETLIIKHPHRQFQHITPIKASWHPIEDIIIVGRYPDDNVLANDTRTVDFYDGLSGELLHKIKFPSGHIASLNMINNIGDTLASAAGFNIFFMSHESMIKRSNSSHGSGYESDDNTPINLLKSKRKQRSAREVHKNIISRKQK